LTKKHVLGAKLDKILSTFSVENIFQILAFVFDFFLQAAVWLCYGESLFELGKLEEAEKAYQQVNQPVLSPRCSPLQFLMIITFFGSQLVHMKK
jgi:hypothetical protein